ncbi:hypothetical protein AH716_002303 [Salmonella enterica subsp. enterica]|nr:hypothetical protein [Salmonella enterica subsp. enterica serovar Gbadago]
MNSTPAVITRVFDIWEIEKGRKYLIDVEVFADGFYRNELITRNSWYQAVRLSPGDDIDLRNIK